MVEVVKINEILINGGATIDILPIIMLKRFGKTLEDPISNNIVVSDYSGKASRSQGMTTLDLIVGSRRRPTFFIVISSQVSINMLLGREWIHGIGAVPSTIHLKFFIWNEKGGLQVVNSNQKSYDSFYVSIAKKHERTMALTTPFEIEDSYYVNQREGNL